MSKAITDMKCKEHRKLSVLLAVVFLLTSIATSGMAAGETPEAVYTGSGLAASILNNLDYTDVKNSNTWAKEAIYATGALGVTKGYGDKQFGRTNSISKEQAIAIAYRVAGREADAQKAAEALDSARQQDEKKANAISMWSDGYLQLAMTDGLITQKEYNDAMSDDQASLEPDSFHRDAPAQRQEMAFWLAKTLKLEPVYGQQKIFNSFNDWKDADPIKVPYIEAVLQKSIMNGNGNGRFGPTDVITREQVAQVVRNAEGVVLPLIKLEKHSGTVERVQNMTDSTSGDRIAKRIIDVRNPNGKLNQIICEVPENWTTENRNEQNGAAINTKEKEAVVYKNGQIGKSSLLGKGDSIEYITSEDKSVKYIRVVSAGTNTEYLAARVNSVDPANLSINVNELFRLGSSNIKFERNNISFSYNNGGEREKLFKYSNKAIVIKDGKAAQASDIKADEYVVLSIRDNVVTAIETFDIGMLNEEDGIVNGIVEDNNPALGYITLYNENGTGTSPSMMEQLIAYRTFNYENKNDVEVFKNHEKATVDDIETGDSVFIKLDSRGYVTSISAVDNYTVKYGKVITKRGNSLTVEYEGGTRQILDVEDNTLVISNKKLTKYSNLKDGDKVKLMLHITNKFTKLKEITIEGDEHFITNVYKGIVSYIDDASNALVVQNVQVLDKGKWVRTSTRGVTDIRLAENYEIYANDRSMNLNSANKYLKNNEAYIAVEKDYGGEEKAVFVSFRNEDDTEVLYDDTVSSSVSGVNQFSLSKDYRTLGYSKGTIVIKDGRLVSGSSITQEDTVYAVANRDYENGEYSAGVVQIGKRSNANYAQIYRGRIKLINDNKEFTMESFSKLDGQTWNYANTPKTINITFSTRMLDDAGVMSTRDFLDYGAASFRDKVVYVVEKDSNALLISTAPYGSVAVRGTVLELTGGTTGEDGSALTEPTGVNLRLAKVYDSSSYVWNDIGNLTLSILKNSIVMKGGQFARASDIKKGDILRIMKKDTALTGDAYIIFVEN
ncbi:MAG: S-layer homology domain-containing protein [Clostridia bacterium]|nr:S-layer homology domain-containing protein [Clostridia bacterium]